MLTPHHSGTISPRAAINAVAVIDVHLQATAGHSVVAISSRSDNFTDPHGDPTNMSDDGDDFMMDVGDSPFAPLTFRTSMR